MTTPIEGEYVPTPRRNDEPVICLGCGSNWSHEQLLAERAKRPKLIACCPERQPVTLREAYEMITKLSIERQTK